MDGGLHHLHLRKRLTQDTCEPFPARTPGMRLLDRVMFFVAFLVPLALFPQALQIYTNADAGGLSLYTWSGLSVANALWALYGYIHRDKIIFMANTLITLLNISIVIGILQYGV